MSRVALTAGAYEARSVIASAQRCCNLFAERNPEDAPVPFTYYPTAGLSTLASAPNGQGWRGLFCASDSKLYGVAGNAVYIIAKDYQITTLGTIGTSSGPVSMADNATSLVIVDGSTAGYSVDLAGATMTSIVDDAFYGADHVAYVDTYFLFNKPGTPQFYVSDSNATTFDSLWFANKVAYSDWLMGLAITHREVWLLGQQTSEVWIDSGDPLFPFQAMQGVFVDYGLAAVHSIGRQDNSLFWLARDRVGQGIVMRGESYQAKRISTFAIETAIARYPVIDDAVGYCYQQAGHPFYVLTFPTADKTWCFDVSTEQWHERVWLDDNGNEHRHRGSCHAFAYGRNVIGDWQNGNLYAFDQDVFSDAGAPMKRVRGFPHMIEDGNRVSYREFIADMEVGRAGAGQTAQVSLRWSDDRGATWGQPVERSLGATGETLTSIQWQRLGLARDRVFELSWSDPVRTALNGAFVEAIPSAH